MPYRYLLWIAVIVLTLYQPSESRENDLAAECDKTKQKIRNIQSKMRSGYTRAQGEKLEAQLRKLREKRKKVCR